MNEERLEALRKLRKELSSLSDEQLLLAGEQIQNVDFLAITQERERRVRKEQHNLNKKIVLITVIGTITATIIGALISTATSYYLRPKPISVTKHVCLHKISKAGNVKTFMKNIDKGEGENKE